MKKFKSFKKKLDKDIEVIIYTNNYDKLLGQSWFLEHDTSSSNNNSLLYSKFKLVLGWVVITDGIFKIYWEIFMFYILILWFVIFKQIILASNR